MDRLTQPSIAIELLADRPDLIAELARLRWHEWSRHPGREDPQWWIDTTRRETGRALPPVTFVAIDETGNASGGIGLVPVEHPELADRGPWVVGAVVRPDRRGRGVGGTLLTGLKLWATRTGIERLWVSTGGHPADFYIHCGFRTTDLVDLPGRDRLTILTVQLGTTD
ncbi:GNAT family N-acetyltransferase [Actinoplanes utahensis]|uniref:N-acetyltransferase domain-containing protein n=1 Tax=Actinoplanes utahensis TaxID=1869 RepID=A0A0A6USD9_ACTUT|nr:GNAT family N-acetyltransferase [Actinoplanes utahensis]KHD77364.1 hypothetical protein MB27_11430 [Actinoplanes utahensis]GIF32890.1 hypothetical protein Aut01nite_58760 [Actinoplanes utahensis]